MDIFLACYVNPILLRHFPSLLVLLSSTISYSTPRLRFHSRFIFPQKGLRPKIRLEREGKVQRKDQKSLAQFGLSLPPVLYLLYFQFLEQEPSLRREIKESGSLYERDFQDFRAAVIRYREDCCWRPF